MKPESNSWHHHLVWATEVFSLNVRAHRVSWGFVARTGDST